MVQAATSRQQRVVSIHPNIDTLFKDLLGRLGLDPRTLPVSPTRAGRPTVGVSDSTAAKLWELYRIIDVVCSYSANICVARLRRHKRPLPFVGIDLSAGIGAYRYTPSGGSELALVGSALQLLDTVVRHNLDYRLGLFERDASVLPLLRHNLALSTLHLGVDSNRVEVVEGDIADTAVDWIARYVRPWMLGLMIIDANGVFDTPEIRTMASRTELKLVDVALHVPACMVKWPERRIPPATLEDLRAAFCKQYWQVAQSRGNYQWTWVYGTNNEKMRVLKERGFAAADSPIGLARFERLSMTHTQRQRRSQVGLFDHLMP
jgi:hypothetical protein